MLEHFTNPEITEEDKEKVLFFHFVNIARQKSFSVQFTTTSSRLVKHSSADLEIEDSNPATV